MMRFSSPVLTFAVSDHGSSEPTPSPSLGREGKDSSRRMPHSTATLLCLPNTGATNDHSPQPSAFPFLPLPRGRLRGGSEHRHPERTLTSKPTKPRERSSFASANPKCPLWRCAP